LHSFFPILLLPYQVKLIAWSESDMSEQESFWNAGSLAVITDKSKPDKGTLQNVSELPSGVDCAVIGVTKRDPADAMEILENKGIKKFWIHWRTETPEVKKRCSGSQIQCITGRCPMMYLGHGINIHTMHRGFAKLMGKY